MPKQKDKSLGQPISIQTTIPGLTQIDNTWANGTWKLLGLSDLVKRWNSPIQWDGKMLVKKATGLFGPSPSKTWCFWREESGHVITVYAGASGPAFGGGPVYFPKLPPSPPTPREGINAAFLHKRQRMTPAAVRLEEELLAFQTSTSRSAPDDPNRQAEFMRVSEALFEENIRDLSLESQALCRTARSLTLGGAHNIELQERHEIIRQATLARCDQGFVSAAQAIADRLYGRL